ncbi:hypothetical protein ACFLZH_04860 [Patescibacteria group bacterium]
MKTHKNTHMYNACTFALCSPTKLVFFGGGGGIGIPSLGRGAEKVKKPLTPEQKEAAALKAQYEKTRKQIVKYLKVLPDANSRELARLDLKEAKSIRAELHYVLFKPGSKTKVLHDDLKFVVKEKIKGSTPKSRYLQAVSVARGKIEAARKDIKKTVLEIKKQRKEGLEKSLGKPPRYKKSAGKFVDNFVEKYDKKAKLLRKQVLKKLYKRRAEQKKRIISMRRPEDRSPVLTAEEKKKVTAKLTDEERKRITLLSDLDQMREIGLAIYAKQAAKFSKDVFYKAEAFKTGIYAGELNEDSKPFKEFQTVLNKEMTDAVKRILESEDAFASEGDLDAKVGVNYFLPGQTTLSVSAQTSIIGWFDTHVIEKKLLQPGKTLYLNIAVFSSPDGSAAANKLLRQKRFEAQKRVILGYVRSLKAKGTKLGNVKFNMESVAAEPDLSLTDFPKKLRAKIEQEFKGPKFAQIKKMLGGAKTLQDALIKIDEFKGSAEARLLMIVRLLGGGDIKAPKKVLAEYNNYIYLRAKKGDLAAEKWLTTYSKHLIKMPHLLKYLNSQVGQQRSVELSVLKENPQLKVTVNTLNKFKEKGQMPKGYTLRAKGRIGVGILKGKRRPDIKITVDPETATTTVKLDGGGKAVFVAGTKFLVPKIRGFVAYSNRMSAQKINKNLKKFRARIAAQDKQGKYKLDYSYIDKDDPTPWSKRIIVSDKSSKKLLGTIEPHMVGNKCDFIKDGMDVASDVLTLTEVTGPKIDTVFA